MEPVNTPNNSQKQAIKSVKLQFANLIQSFDNTKELIKFAICIDKKLFISQLDRFISFKYDRIKGVSNIKYQLRKILKHILNKTKNNILYKTFFDDQINWVSVYMYLIEPVYMFLRAQTLDTKCSELVKQMTGLSLERYGALSVIYAYDIQKAKKRGSIYAYSGTDLTRIAIISNLFILLYVLFSVIYSRDVSSESRQALLKNIVEKYNGQRPKLAQSLPAMFYTAYILERGPEVPGFDIVPKLYTTTSFLLTSTNIVHEIMKSFFIKKDASFNIDGLSDNQTYLSNSSYRSMLQKIASWHQKNITNIIDPLMREKEIYAFRNKNVFFKLNTYNSPVYSRSKILVAYYTLFVNNISYNNIYVSGKTHEVIWNIVWKDNWNVDRPISITYSSFDSDIKKLDRYIEEAIKYRDTKITKENKIMVGNYFEIPRRNSMYITKYFDILPLEIKSLDDNETRAEIEDALDYCTYSEFKSFPQSSKNNIPVPKPFVLPNDPYVSDDDDTL